MPIDNGPYKGPVIAELDAQMDQLAADAQGEGAASRDEEVAALTREADDLGARLDAAVEDYHDTLAEFEAYKASHPDTGDPPPPDPEPEPEPEPEPQPKGLPYLVGISRSTGGLNHSEGAKSTETKERFDQMAKAIGETPADMRAMGGRHVYYTGSSLPADLEQIGVVANCAVDGYGNCMFTASRLGDRAGRADGSWNDRIKALLKTKHKVPGSALDRMKMLVNFDHEPSNDSTPWDAAQWQKVQAQAAKAIWEMDDPTVYYTTCHIPVAVDSRWLHLAALKQIAPDDWQAIDARTYNGLDPYPEAEAGTPPTYGTVWGRIDKAVGAIRNAGLKGPLSFPEVALFHYDDTGSNQGPVALSAADQAKRLHDNFCDELQAKDDVRAAWYFDVTDVNNPRGDTRILQTAEEQAEWGKCIRGDAGHFGR